MRTQSSVGSAPGHGRRNRVARRTGKSASGSAVSSPATSCGPGGTTGGRGGAASARAPGRRHQGGGRSSRRNGCWKAMPAMWAPLRPHSRPPRVDAREPGDVREADVPMASSAVGRRREVAPGRVRPAAGALPKSAGIGVVEAEAGAGRPAPGSRRTSPRPHTVGGSTSKPTRASRCRDGRRTTATWCGREAGRRRSSTSEPSAAGATRKNSAPG